MVDQGIVMSERQRKGATPEAVQCGCSSLMLINIVHAPRLSISFERCSWKQRLTQPTLRPATNTFRLLRASQSSAHFKNCCRHYVTHCCTKGPVLSWTPKPTPNCPCRKTATHFAGGGGCTGTTLFAGGGGITAGGGGITADSPEAAGGWGWAADIADCEPPTPAMPPIGPTPVMPRTTPVGPSPSPRHPAACAAMVADPPCSAT